MTQEIALAQIFFASAFVTSFAGFGFAMVVYVRSITDDPLKFKSFMASIFSFQFVSLAVVYGATGMFTREGLITSAIFSPAVVLGSVAGFGSSGTPLIMCIGW